MWKRLTNWAPKGEPSRTPRVAKKGDDRPLTDKLKPTVDERTAEAAVGLLENPAFEKVLDRLRTGRLAEFAGAKPGPEGFQTREAAHAGLAAIDKIRDDVTAMADELKLHRADRSQTENWD